MTAHAPPAPRIFWAVYVAPHGCPGEYYVRRWEARPGEPSKRGAPIYAPTLHAAHRFVPEGMEWLPRTEANGEPDNLVGVWRERQPKKPRRKRP